MKILIDAFGGDNAPLEIVKGSVMAASEYDVEIILCGDENILKKIIEEQNILDRRISILHAPQVINMDDDPQLILKEKSDSSMSAGLRALAKGEADAFVTAGSTGAVLVGASLIVKRIRGIKRAALATLMPTTASPCMLIDCGANVECRPEFLNQFALMGSIYMNKIQGIDSPRVALLNNGTEKNKGTPFQIESHELMEKAENYNFIGNVEGRDIPLGGCDVAVADGFSGNIVLKTYEGVGLAFMGQVKEVFTGKKRGLLAALLVKRELYDMKKRLDYSEYGGAPLLGISKPVIKAHGSSKAKAIKNAVRQAVNVVDMQVIPTIIQALAHENVIKD